MGWQPAKISRIEHGRANISDVDLLYYLGFCSADMVEVAVDLLAQEGPRLGRPMVDRIQGSAYHNVKELRPASTGSSEIRVLFAFDPRRRAILLVPGDKSGSWDTWYRTTIPVADQRYAEHPAEQSQAISLSSTIRDGTTVW